MINSIGTFRRLIITSSNLSAIESIVDSAKIKYTDTTITTIISKIKDNTLVINMDGCSASDAANYIKSEVKILDNHAVIVYRSSAKLKKIKK